MGPQRRGRGSRARGGITYIGGYFTSVGPNTGHGVPIDTASGNPWASFPKVTGVLRAAAPDGSGGFYIAGEFTGIGGIARNNIAHVLPGGGLDPSWNPDCNGPVAALAVSGSVIYAGGAFTTVNGGATARNNIAAFDNTTGAVDTTWNPDCNSTVLAFAISGSTIYTGGGFTTVNGGATARHFVAAFNNTDGTATSWDPVCDNSVRALVVSGSTVYAGGVFSAVGLLACPHFAVFTTPTITSCSPTSAAQGRTLDVTITGVGTHFQSGTSQVTFSGTGTTVNSTTVIDATHARANITINTTAPVGARDVNIITGTETPALLTGGFTVTGFNPCGGGSGSAAMLFGLTLGLLSLAGSGRLRRKLHERTK